ncbi:MAG: 16S rRNA (uracil(1498)-N(3))-methyltransferase [Rikenellaceae bacterium]
MQLFYAPNIKPPHYTLSEEESKHAVRVLRLCEGDSITITNGTGTLFSCRVIDAAPKRCTVEVVSAIEEYEPLPYSLTLCVAPTKNIERFEWFLEKATEIGISEVYTLLSSHSERKSIKWEREAKVITAAMKQSLKAYHPTLHDTTPFSSIISRTFDGERFIAHCGEPLSAEGKRFLGDVVPTAGNIEIMIGPEGDFSPEEVEAALAKGYREISLGSQRLRTETAAVVAVSIVATKSEMKQWKE